MNFEHKSTGQESTAETEQDKKVTNVESTVPTSATTGYYAHTETAPGRTASDNQNPAQTDFSSSTYYTQSANPSYYTQSTPNPYGNYPGYAQQNGGTSESVPGNGNAYSSWNTDSMQTYQQQPYYQQPKKPERKKQKKRKGNRTGLKVVGVIMCCLITSSCVLGVFVGLIQNGTIAVESSESNRNDTPAYTINKVIEDESSSSNTTVGSGVSLLTKQEIAEKVVTSVVCLQIYTNTTSNLYGFGGYGSNEDESTLLEPTSQGSGIVYTEDGYIITNAHVISGASNIKVITTDGETYEAEVVGEDTVTDLAVVKIIDADDVTFIPAEFGASSDLKVADEVIAIGNPGGIELNSTVTMGYVSALDREVTDSDSGYTMKCIQTDAAINPGNSGGALVNMYGQVIGINSSKIAATGYEGLGFAIPSDTAQPIITDLMNYGYVKDRAMLGISGQYIDSLTGQFYNLEAGMYIAQINTQEALDSGLQVYDVITAIDGNEVTSSGSITSYLLDKKPGDTVELTVSRSSTGIGSNEKETLTLQLVLTESSQYEEVAAEAENSQEDENTQEWPGGR